MSEAPFLLTDIASSVGASQADRAVDGAMRALQTGTAPIEVIRAAARGAALHYDVGVGRPPMGLAALGAATNLFPFLEARLHPLPTLQAVVLAASEKKAAQPARPPALVNGEITHLGRSFLFAARDGNLPEAESIFLGMIREGVERRIAGDILFRAAAEDMGHGGLKLVVAVKLWQLARALHFRDARTILRPAVQFLVAGARDGSSYRAVLETLGKEWVDLEGLATGGRPLDAEGRGKASATLGTGDPAACVAGTLALLQDGFAASSLAETFSVEAAKGVLAAKEDARAAADGLLVAHAARFVISFTRSPDRLFALFQTALRLRSPASAIHRPLVQRRRGDRDEFARIVDALEARQSDAAVARTRSYLERGRPRDPLLGMLVEVACRDSAVGNEGLNVLLADACASETLASRAPEPAMALAKSIASSNADRTPYEAWSSLFAR